jgi:hypothetical protein
MAEWKISWMNSWYNGRFQGIMYGRVADFMEECIAE